MADVIELMRMSLNSIKRVDPYVKEILSTATHVALYKFNTAQNEWERTNTEGALFVYSRNGEPYHSIMVMNRLNANNVIEPIVKEFDYQMQVPFLLYKNSKNKIFGIWFFNREECINITYLIESIMDGLKGKSDGSSLKKENGIDIFSMLSKAQEDFNKTPTKQNSVPSFSSTPRVPDVTSQSVMEFFAKSQAAAPVSSEQHVLQRLMSNPAHSVEHIEKQQRSITPQELVNMRQKPANPCADRRSVPISFPSTSGADKNSISDDGIRISPFKDKSQMSASPLLNLMHNTQHAYAHSAQDESKGFQQLMSKVQSVEKPQLMTPMMFQTTNAKEKVHDDRPDLLTEKQLAQALIFLLKNDSHFTKVIHEAYVSSLMESLNLSNNNKSKI
ncbi:unnamed protein product [Brassicogethes aeneus]|uniref:mRNA-decapping enzyme C-terminal domain-containing protein n=1 Tax=Brassicogethes aeneus TaxID=1431903 RepID=A0A9P0FIY1_BRAAE|nr:unnamed protein product [Brassicogethes aeneus]